MIKKELYYALDFMFQEASLSQGRLMSDECDNNRILLRATHGILVDLIKNMSDVDLHSMCVDRNLIDKLLIAGVEVK